MAAPPPPSCLHGDSTGCWAQTVLRMGATHPRPRRKLPGDPSELMALGMGGASEVGHLLDYTPEVVLGLLAHLQGQDLTHSVATRSLSEQL